MTKPAALALLCVVLVCGMSPWFATAAVLADMAREGGFGAGRQALLTSGVQAGFAAGAVISAVLGLTDRFDPRRVMACAAQCPRQWHRQARGTGLILECHGTATKEARMPRTVRFGASIAGVRASFPRQGWPKPAFPAARVVDSRTRKCGLGGIQAVVGHAQS